MQFEDTVRLKTLYKISQQINGTQNKFTVYWDHCRFCFRYMMAPSIAKEMQSLQEDEDIRALFDLRPKMYDQPTHHYVCVNWDKAARVKNLSYHLNFMSKQLGEKSKYAYSEEGYKLFSIEGNHGEHYDVRLCLVSGVKVLWLSASQIKTYRVCIRQHFALPKTMTYLLAVFKERKAPLIIVRKS